jgi:hypothetical protein
MTITVKEIVIHPTHTCFDDALDLVEDLMKSDSSFDWKNCLIVHGIADCGQLYSHAWLEYGDCCIEMGILDGERVIFEQDKKKYYESRKISDVTKYTVHEALKENLKHEHYGPWEQKYLELCKDYEGNASCKNSENAAQEVHDSSSSTT